MPFFFSLLFFNSKGKGAHPVTNIKLASFTLHIYTIQILSGSPHTEKYINIACYMVQQNLVFFNIKNEQWVLFYKFYYEQ